jgi:putative ABC transport system permease protein
MLKNYIKIAIRNLIKNKAFSFINIAGMTIGLASAMLIGLFVWDDLQYDQYYPDKDSTYRIYNVMTSDNGDVDYIPSIPPTYGPKLLADYPEVESTLRIMNAQRDFLLTIDGEKTYVSGAIYAEPSIFDMLDVELNSGSSETALDNPGDVIISEELASKLFHEADPVGQSIELNNYTCTVKGVYKNFPAYSHLNPPIILSFSSFSQYVSEERINSWAWHQFYTYVKFNQIIDQDNFELKLANFVERYSPKMEEFGFTYQSHLQNISDIYLHSSNFERDLAKRGSAYTLYALMAAGIFILIIVCLNFVNLSTAQSMSRMKEVGVRKVIGAGRKHLILQFIGESITITLIAALLAGFLAEMSISFLNSFSGKQLSFDIFMNPMFAGLLFLFILTLGVVAGLYPAVYASNFNPLSGLGGKGSPAKNANSSFRNGMLVIQFVLSTSLIIVSIVVYQQVGFLRNSDLGFDKEHVITIPLKPGLRKNLETTKQLFLANPHITATTYSFGLPGDIVAGDGVIDPVLNKSISSNLFLIDHDYIGTMGLEIVAGRDFEEEIASDASEAFVINETAVKTLGYQSAEEAIGKRLDWDMWHYDSLKKGRVIGVVKDFHFASMREEISTSVLHIYPRSYYKMALRLDGENIKETIQFIEKTWAELEPTWPISYSFIDQDFDKMYKNEKSLGTLITVFTGIGIFSACLGLFGLVNYSTRLRLKEVGIRKTLGASVSQITVLLTQRYFMLLTVSFLLAIPLSVYVMNAWLSGFAYRIAISPSIFVIAIGTILLIALLSVSYQSIKAALTNPVNVLKDE